MRILPATALIILLLLAPGFLLPRTHPGDTQERLIENAAREIIAEMPDLHGVETISIPAVTADESAYRANQHAVDERCLNQLSTIPSGTPLICIGHSLGTLVMHNTLEPLAAGADGLPHLPFRRVIYLGAYLGRNCPERLAIAERGSFNLRGRLDFVSFSLRLGTPAPTERWGWAFPPHAGLWMHPWTRQLIREAL